MADKKISQLSNATTPVAGTEVLPIVQSSSTVKVSIDNLTKGRTVNASAFDTDVAAAGVTLSGTTLAADGTDANININVTPKGTGEVALPKVNIDGGAIDGTAIGANSASTGAFTTLSASSTVSGTGFSTYLASPPAIGGTVAAAGSFTTLSATGNVNLNGGTLTFNDAGADLDARFEGDTDANLLFTDASTDRVGVGTNTPAQKFDVNGTAQASRFFSASGTTASTASGTPVTAFTAPVTNGTYYVCAVLSNADDPTNYNPVSLLRINRNGITITSIAGTATMTITLSGYNVQLTQGTGSSQAMSWSYIRLL